MTAHNVMMAVLIANTALFVMFSVHLMWKSFTPINCKHTVEHKCTVVFDDTTKAVLNQIHVALKTYEFSVDPNYFVVANPKPSEPPSKPHDPDDQVAPEDPPATDNQPVQDHSTESVMPPPILSTESETQPDQMTPETTTSGPTTTTSNAPVVATH